MKNKFMNSSIGFFLRYNFVSIIFFSLLFSIITVAGYHFYNKRKQIQEKLCPEVSCPEVSCPKCPEPEIDDFEKNRLERDFYRKKANCAAKKKICINKKSKKECDKEFKNCVENITKKVVCPKLPEEKLKKCPTEFQVFKKAYWPSFLENECGPSKINKCCSKDENDAGGLTCYGVSIEHNHTFYEYLESLGILPKHLKDEDISKIDSTPIEPYSQMKIYMGYFKRPKIYNLPVQLREVVFDNAVHAGPGRAIKILQKACGSHIDGHIGPSTVKQCKNLSADEYIQKRKEFLKTRPSWQEFENGFKARLKRQKTQDNDVIKREIELKKNCVH